MDRWWSQPEEGIVGGIETRYEDTSEELVLQKGSNVGGLTEISSFENFLDFPLTNRSRHRILPAS